MKIDSEYEGLSLQQKIISLNEPLVKFNIVAGS